MASLVRTRNDYKNFILHHEIFFFLNPTILGQCKFTDSKTKIIQEDKCAANQKFEILCCFLCRVDVGYDQICSLFYIQSMQGDLGQRVSTKSRTDVIRKTDSINKVNQGPRYKKTTSNRRTQINTKDSKNWEVGESKRLVYLNRKLNVNFEQKFQPKFERNQHTIF